MHRVELKVKDFSIEEPPHREFLMHRVELKVKDFSIEEPPHREFLMHRVELKADLHLTEAGIFYQRS